MSEELSKHKKMPAEKQEVIAEFEEYFKEDLDAINEELAESKRYSNIINTEIDRLSSPSLATKGSQHYLIEHITNAVNLQTQREGLRKDKVAIKKTIMDYAIRSLDKKKNENLDDSNFMEAINRLLEEEKSKERKLQKPVEIIQKNVDDEIDMALSNVKEDE